MSNFYKFNNYNAAMTELKDLWREKLEEENTATEYEEDDEGCAYCATIRANPDGEYDPPAVNGMCYLCYEEECVTCEGCFEGIHKENDKWFIAENYCYNGDGTKTLGTYDYCYDCFYRNQGGGTFESTDGDLWEFTEEGPERECETCDRNEERGTCTGVITSLYHFAYCLGHSEV